MSTFEDTRQSEAEAGAVASSGASRAAETTGLGGLSAPQLLLTDMPPISTPTRIRGPHATATLDGDTITLEDAASATIALTVDQARWLQTAALPALIAAHRAHRQ